MQIKVNDKEVEIFAGACVKDAVLKYSRAAWKQIQDRTMAIFDRYGHEVAADGELSGGEEIFVRRSGENEKNA